MKYLIFKITDGNYPICISKEEEKIEYIVASKESKKILLNKENIKNIKIIDGIISFEIDGVIVKIINYSNAKEESDLYNIIKYCKRIRLQKKREYLRKKKVKRIKKIATNVTATLLAGVTTFSIIYKLLKEDDEQFYEDFNEISTTDINQDYLNETIDYENLNEQFVCQNYYVNYNDRTDTDKYKYTKNTYYDTIAKISNAYGIDPKIMLGIATQETGGEKMYFDSYAKGLMQIEKSVWNNETLKAFNYNTNTYENIKVDGNKLLDTEYNIRVACMIFQNCLRESNFNLPIAIQRYNYGIGNIKKVLKYCYGTSEVSIETGLDWLDSRNIINVGDSNYLEHVLSYINNSDDIVCLDSEGNKIKYQVSCQKLNKSL